MKIKINWGTGIAIFIVFFIITMAFLFYKATTINNDLVEQDYYPKELAYQDEIDMIQNLHRLGEDPRIKITTEGIEVLLPSHFDGKEIAGNVHLYRAADIKLDIHDTLVSTSWQVPPEKLRAGAYTMNITWSSQDTAYHWEQDFIYEMR